MGPINCAPNPYGAIYDQHPLIRKMLRNHFFISNIRNIGINHHLSQGGQSRDTHVVISHVLFSFFARFKVCFTIIFLFFGGFQKCHLVQSTQTRKLFLMALKF